MHKSSLLGILIFLAAMGCESATTYKAELINYASINSVQVDEFEVYEIKENKLQVALKFQLPELYLKIINNSDEIMTFLPLDVNLSTAENRCSIRGIFEDFIWKKSHGKKVNFETKYTIEKKTTKVFYYKFDCQKSSMAFLTINGLQQNNKKIVLNFIHQTRKIVDFEDQYPIFFQKQFNCVKSISNTVYVR